MSNHSSDKCSKEELADFKKKEVILWLKEKGYYSELSLAHKALNLISLRVKETPKVLCKVDNLTNFPSNTK